MTITDNTCATAFGCCIADDAQASNEDFGALSSPIDQPITEKPDNNNRYATIALDDARSEEFRFPRRIAVNVEFNNIRYTVGRISMAQRKYVSKEILHGISGTFCSGELTAIMGPSGAGKSTLLNILAGYVESGVTGCITVNGKNRSTNSQTFRSLSAYIHQMDEHRKYLTVAECMTAAAHLKLGFGVSGRYKEYVIQQVLELLGLEGRRNTPSGRLSGGQQKRLSIALELINNPPVIFLDEPTTGLDSSSTASCISLLKRLAQDGRTIVCTIHQPSALLFEMFDKLYAVADGRCIYQGSTGQLVPFLADLGLPCPNYHNPADFLLEVSVGDYESDLGVLCTAAERKYNDERQKHIQAMHVFSKSMHLDESSDKQLLQRQLTEDRCGQTSTGMSVAADASDRSAPASLMMQFFLLFMRNLNCSLRNKFLIMARLVTHTVIGILFGLIYVDVGPNAAAVLGNYVYLYGTVLLIVYTGKMSVLLSFPLEMEILTREHFNRWYQLGPYYLSVILFEMPFQMVTASLYVFTSYYLTGNFYELFRFNYFLLMCMMVTVCAQSWGFFIGVVMPIKLAVFVGPILAVVFSIFGFCTRLVDITPMFSWMWHISYFRVAFHGILNTVYGMNRPNLHCPDTQPLMYCHFKNPRIFLSDMLIDDQPDLRDNIMLMGGVTVAMHVLTAMVLWLRLNKR